MKTKQQVINRMLLAIPPLRKKIVQRLKDHAYQGYLSIEFEGKASPREGIPPSIKLLQDTLLRLN